MIPIRERSKQTKDEFSFDDWAALFPDGIFVKAVIIYADESGTHDPTGNQPGSKFPTIAGFAAPPSEWSQFCIDWQAVLTSYSAPYFHFREWAAASAAIRFNRPETPDLKKNPYYGWDVKKLDKFLFTLAKIAGSGNKVPISGSIRTEIFHQIKADLKTSNPDNIQWGEDPFKFAMGQFFQMYHRETWIRWRDFKSPVTLFLDQNDDSKWREAFHEVYSAVAKADTRLSGIAFLDKKKPHGLPLQAADMLAYRMRQVTNKMDDGSYDVSKLDKILIMNFLKGTSKIRREIMSQ